MNDNLFIKNYRNLKELKLNSLARVNLITGKNNTGKSTVLEAIAIYASKGDINFIYQLLNERGENFRLSDSNKNATEVNVKALSSLFSEWNFSFDKNDAISIGDIENTLFGAETSSDSLLLSFVKYIEEIQKDSQGDIARRTKINIDKEHNQHFENYKVGFEIRTGNSSYIIPLDQERPYRLWFRGSMRTNFQFIRTRNIEREINGKLWDNITLTENESYVIDALKIIEPETERIAFIEDSVRDRTAVIKLKNSNTIYPLRSMGDGINRILTIILAIVNSKNGYLLLDEFENGLHYTVQEKLWQIIFNLSEKLNIQVFVTTHSDDCINGFEQVLNSSDYKSSGKLIRLENNLGFIRQVEFNSEELKTATSQDIETR